MALDERLYSHPVVYKEAERRAKELWPLLHGSSPFDGGADCRKLIKAQVTLLADVSRPSTLDWLMWSGLAADDTISCSKKLGTSLWWRWTHLRDDGSFALVVAWLEVQRGK